MRVHAFTGYLNSTVFVLSLVAASSAFAAPPATPQTVPPGITLIDVLKEGSNQFLWRRLGDDTGRPLYTFNKDAEAGRSACVEECAKEFPPFMAASKATASGDWSLIARDGGKQWAYQGQPLYYYTGKDPAQAGGARGRGDNDPALLDPGSKFFSPKSDWKRAAFTPGVTTPTPSGLDLQSIATANGYGMVDATTKRVTYVLKNPPKNPAQWTPSYAPAMAVPIGDFTIMVREDGTRQWAYKGQRLYGYTGDYSSSDTNGLLVEKEAAVALAYKHFMPAAFDINIYPGRGPILVTKEGMSVYTESRQQLQYGGRETRDGYRFTYVDAKAVGTRGCVDECTKTWKPVLAPAGAQPSGFWEVQDRGDGNKQWAYKGSPLYTFSGDRKPGDIDGNNRHVIVFGDKNGLVDLSVTGGDVLSGKNSTGSGLYWHLAGLFY